MLKQHKGKLVVSSLLILLPMLVGVCIWNKLPNPMPIHWNAAGDVDGYAPRAVAVVALPLICLALQWLCVFVTACDPKNQGQNAKVTGLVVWLVPLICAVVSAMIYTTALGYAVSATNLAMGMLGIIFVLLGNYMPKCKQNHTIGIKISWTLNDEENWNATHRLAGRVWVIGGVLMLLCTLLPSSVFPWIFLALTLLMVLIPFVYSYTYYCRHK